MYNHFQLAIKYLRHYAASSNGKGHGVHSPLVFEFITKVLNDNTYYPAYQQVEDMRNKLLKDNTLLTVDDMGAGSAMAKTRERTIASIAKNAAKPKKFGQLLYRMVKYYQPGNIIELGTSLGITTSYLSLAKPEATLITMEGAASVANLAKKNFEALGLENVRITPGNFDASLSTVVNELPSADFVFIDGNHRLQPTIRYFQSLLTKTNNFSIVILDDIHWSDEMEKAWQYCKEHSSVTLSIDLFFIGILVFRKEIREKQHFRIRF